MAKQNIPPTKSNLNRIKQSYIIAKEGHELLDQKREIMVMELMSYLERTKRVEKDLNALLAEAYAAYKKAVVRMGHREAENVARSIKYEYIMKEKTTKLMGMNMPSVHAETPHLQLQGSFLDSNALTDEVSAAFLRLISVLGEMAEIRNIVWRLSREVKKTQRRVNALEKSVIPEAEETIKFITSSLEERERDELFIVKMVKEKYGDQQ
ncbi:MAG: V-type ATP synthase subunit D [Spirochaetales bacterium]|jgi:V/A-type H+-transporting ATPase subunit D|nr:V-type ATP synthase subunit D [Spirochaetales bacterium]